MSEALRSVFAELGFDVDLATLEKADKALIRKSVKKTALKMEGHHAHERSDRAKRARGGRSNKKGGKTVVNVIAGGQHPPMMAGGPPPMSTRRRTRLSFLNSVRAAATSVKLSNRVGGIGMLFEPLAMAL